MSTMSTWKKTSFLKGCFEQVSIDFSSSVMDFSFSVISINLDSWRWNNKKDFYDPIFWWWKEVEKSLGNVSRFQNRVEDFHFLHHLCEKNLCDELLVQLNTDNDRNWQKSWLIEQNLPQPFLMELIGLSGRSEGPRGQCPLLGSWDTT